MVTRASNIAPMTCDIFIHTSNYMKHLIDELSQISDSHVPQGVWRISQELIESLTKFMERNSNINLRPLNACSSIQPKNFQKGPNDSINIGDSSADKGHSGMNVTHISCSKNKFDLTDVNSHHSEKQKISLSKAEPNDGKQAIYSSSSSLAASSVYSENINTNKKKKRNQFYVTEVFNSMLNIIKNSDEKIYPFYCRSCNFASYSLAKWNEHVLSDEKHLSSVDSNRFVNKELLCSECNLMLLGDIHVMRKYMEYHNVIVHGSGEVNPVEKYEACRAGGIEEFKKKELDTSEGAVCRPNVTEIDLKHASKTKRKPRKKKAEENKTGLLKPEVEFSHEASSHSIDLEIENVSYLKNLTEPISVKDGNKQIDAFQNHDKFYDLIDHIKSKVAKDVWIYGNYCFSCNESFLCGFEWMDHLENITHLNNNKSRSEVHEQTCRVCSMKLFGESTEISEHLLSSEHIELDRDFKKKFY